MEAPNARSEVQHAARSRNSASSRMETPDAPGDVPTDAPSSNVEGGPRPLGDIIADLHEPIPERLLETRRQGGQEITYVPWYRAQKILNHYTRGFWEYRVVERWQQGDPSDGGDFMMTVEITIHTAEGTFRRQGTGREEPGVAASEKGFGDTQSNAESMAFRRAAAKWGLGLDLYEGGA